MDPIGSAVGPVIGYAIGTIQILALDWFRRRSSHATQLRLIRAELRRLGEYQTGFEWQPQSPPPDDQIPRPPEPTPNFLKVVGEIDFYLTDEHHDDNTQLALLNIVDGCQMLGHYFEKIDECLQEVRVGTGPAAVKSWTRAIEYSQSYDGELAKLQAIIRRAMEDCERRLRDIRFWHQVSRRPVGRLPPGDNPPPLSPQDPRIKPLPTRRAAGGGSPPGRGRGRESV